jgi:hypothetical protein
MHDDDFDRDLAQRLRAYESRLPDGAMPNISAASRRPVPWARLALAAGAIGAAVAVGAIVLGPPATPIGDASSAPASPMLSPTTPMSSPVASPTVASNQTETADPTRAPVDIVFRHATEATLEYVVGFGNGESGRIAAVNVMDGAQVPPVGPWNGSGAIYAERSDGSWELVDTEATFRDVELTALLNPPGGPMVLYGRSVDAESPRRISGVWTSTDGQTWVERPNGLFGEVVAEGPLGYVVARRMVSTDADVIELHLSEDGVNWELVETVDVGPGAYPQAAGAGPEGFVVAVGDVGHAPIILASGDGRTWFEAPPQATLTSDDIVMAVAPSGPDWVAAGWRSVSGPAEGIDLWRSADGLNWEAGGSIPASEVEAVGTRVLYPSHLVSRGDRLFLSAARAVEGSETRPLAVWTSSDGRSWEEIDFGGPAEVRAVAVTDCCFLLGGRLGMDVGDAAIWRWDPPAG